MQLIDLMTDMVLGRTRLTATEKERVIVLRDGKLADILAAGRHAVKRRGLSTQWHDLKHPEFVSDYALALMRNRPDLVATHFTEVATGRDEVAIVYRDGRAFAVVTPDQRRLFWTEAGPWTSTLLNVAEDTQLEMSLAQRLMRSGLSTALTRVEVPAGKVAVLTVDGADPKLLDAGTYTFWNLGRKHEAKLVDMRWQSREVVGQDILTRDRVTLRVNVTATYRITDAMVAVGAVKDFVEALHLALQLAFRKTLGGVTLDQLLADKVTVNAEAAELVRTEMAGLGVEVGEIALKDVILPGEMREILNQVVAAQKEAEANVIRRREETNATRSLLNTAKVMAENPVMLRLKELEALEVIAGKVERLTVHNGTEGLMSDVVRLRD
ncbi:slipin family protein [Ascidiaceihabitans sp.]|uniref:slipin family protein n=1 Tax=Ascidiaceihabitans sp. TaxID=1872644 RepID=UPI0032974BB7